MAAQPGATLSPDSQPAPTANTTSAASKSGHLSTDDTMRTLLDHPAFAGFARLLLPWDDRPYDPRMCLADLGTLLPYHSQIRPDVMVGAMNHLIDDAAAGTTIFHDIYTPAQKQQSPSKQHTGLFFFRGKPGAPFAIICAGGGFSYVGSIHEGFPYATDIVQQGHNVFVLKYRVGVGGEVATEDLAAAISYVFANAATLGVGIHDYSLWGSSAGARMVAAIGTRGVAGFGGDKRPLPAAIVMAYTGHTEHATSGDPPTFVVVGENDGMRLGPHPG